MLVTCVGGGNVVGGARGELSDLYCGLHRHRGYAALFSWHPLETCPLSGGQDKNTEPTPEREGQKNYLKGKLAHSMCMHVANPVLLEIVNAARLLNIRAQTTQGQTVESRPTCLKNVIGFWPMAWASPMLALMTSVKGFLTPWKEKDRELRKVRLLFPPPDVPLSVFCLLHIIKE